MRNGVALVLVSLLALSTSALAQDVTIERQFDRGEAIADGGTIASTTAGFWKGLPGKFYTVGFSRSNDSNTVLIVTFQGTVRWGADGKIITGTADEFRPGRMKTETSDGQWVAVTSFKVDEGQLWLTAATGETFVCSGFLPRFHGLMELRRADAAPH